MTLFTHAGSRDRPTTIWQIAQAVADGEQGFGQFSGGAWVQLIGVLIGPPDAT
jgi:hypothetical protein